MLCAVLVMTAAGQAKKPVLMVVPSDSWCNSNGYVYEFDNQGAIEKIPDYNAALLNSADLRLLITKMGAIMAERGFPLQDLEQSLKNLRTEAAEMSLITSSGSGSAIAESPIERLNRTAKADILIDMSFSVKKNGPVKQVTFNVRALDAYTSKQISGVTGVSSPSSAAPVELLLEEAVLSYMDNFTAQLQGHFDDMFANGREIKVTMRRFESCPFDFETEFDYNGQSAELADILGVWFEDNCVQGRFSQGARSSNTLVFAQVRMPLYGKSLSGREVAIDATAFMRPMVSMLGKDPYNVPVKIYPKGQGEVWLIVGEK